MSFEGRLAADVTEAVRSVYGIELEDVHVERPNDPGHGDFATNVALANARVFRGNPREVAENLVEALKKKGGRLAAASVQKQLQAAQAAESLSGGKGSK